MWSGIRYHVGVDSRRVQEAKRKASTEFPYSPIKKRLRSSELCFKYQGDVEDDSVSSNCSLTSTQMPCFICGQVGEKTWSFHKASTFDVSNKVWLVALKTKNYTLAAKFSEGDMIATDAEYRLRCVSSLYRAANLVENETEMNKEEREAKELAFIELIDLIETYRGTGVTLPIAQCTAGSSHLQTPPAALGPYP